MKWGVFLLIMLFSIVVKAQLVTGFVKDNKGDALPFVSVYYSSSTEGTVSNGKGYFQLRYTHPNDTLVFFSAGYEEVKLSLKKVGEAPLNIVLHQEAQELNTVIIKGKSDKAKTIIKNAMKARRGHLKSLQSFQANAYVKVSLEEDNIFAENQKIRLNFIETYSKIKFMRPGKWKVEKLAVKDLSKKTKDKGRFEMRIGRPSRAARKSSTNPNIFFSEFTDGDFNFYKNTIYVSKLGEVPYISPIGALALTSYQFDYIDGFYENGRLVHKIHVEPRRAKDALFSGTLYIQEGTWAIVALELSLPKTALHYFKEFKIYQSYEEVDSVFVLKRQEFFYKVKRGGDNLYGTVYSAFKDYQVNIDFPKNTFGNLIRLTVDSANIRDTTFWDSVRAVPLKKNEAKFVKQVDSIDAYQKSPEYLAKQDSINNRVSLINVTLNGIDYYNRSKGVKWIIDPLVKQMKIFGVGGYRHALGGTYIKTFESEHELSVSAQADYGFVNNDLLANGKIQYMYLPKKFAHLRVSGGAKYQMMSYMQNLATIFSRSNYVRNDFIQVGHYHELVNGLFLDFRAKYMKRTSIDGLELAGWSNDIFGDDNTPREFEPYNELNLKLELEYTPFMKYALEPKKKVLLGSKWPTFHATWEQGIPGVLDSKINYQLVKLGLTKTLKWNVFGTGRLAVWSGKYLHTTTVEYPNMTFFRGTDNYFFSHPIYTFQLLGKTHTAAAEFAELHYIHHFNGMFIKKVPLLNKTRLETVAGGGMLYINENNFAHSEIYGGVDYPFKLWDTKLKVGVYYAVAYSNYSNLANMVKFGINVFNPFSNEWAF